MKRIMIGLLLISTIQIGEAQTQTILNKSLQYIDRPYTAHTLEIGNKEQLIINKSNVDCTTFIEYTLAEVLADSRGDITEEEYLKKIRYREGLISGYASRLHYITEWIEEGVKNKFIEDISNKYATDSIITNLSYMSEHPQYYKHLQTSKENLEAIKRVEARLKGKIIHWLPKDKLPIEGLEWIKDGDIIVLTSSIRGLDTSHMGIAIYQGDKLHLLHASSSKGRVIIEPTPLSTMLKNSRSWSGIRVVRPLLKGDYNEEESNNMKLDYEDKEQAISTIDNNN